MKAISIGSTFIILTACLLTGCKKDSSIGVGEAPTLTVNAEILNGPTLNDNGEVIATDTIDFSITVSAPAGFNSVLIGGSGNSILTESEIGSMDSLNQTNVLSHRVITGENDGGAQASFVFVAVDALGQESDSVRFSFNIGYIVKTYTNVILGGFPHTTIGGYYDAIDDIVYTLSNAIVNTNDIDLLFYHEGSQAYSLAAVDNTAADIAIQSQTASGDLDDFPTQNPTRFRIYTTNPNFDGVRSVTDLTNAYSAGTSSSGLSNVTNLSANDVIGVVLTSSRGDRVGLIRINQLIGTSASDRAIRFEIKIEP